MHTLTCTCTCILTTLFCNYSNTITIQLDGSQSQQTQTQTDLMTQNELTQLGDDSTLFDEENNSNSPPSAINPKQVAWGRLIAEEGEGRCEMIPRNPTNNTSTKQQVSAPAAKAAEHDESINFLGCLQVHKSDKFNEFNLGRNSKMDIVPPKPNKNNNNQKDHYKIHEWAHSMVSNHHCTVYCMLKEPNGDSNSMDVFVEDSSGNGTIINGSTLLKRGEKRLLHTGDQICLVNPHPLRKKIRNPLAIQQVQRRYTYIFVNVYQQQQAMAASTNGKRKRPPPSSVKRRKGIVDARAVVNHSMEQHTRNTSPRATPTTTAGNNPVRITADKQKRVEQFYDIRDTLGTGTCGIVKRAISRKTGKEFAVKIIELGGRNRGALLSDKESAALKAEASILQALDHPYIVKLHDVFVNPNVAIYLVMELMSGGDLFDRIVQKSRYTEVESRRTMRRLFNAVYYLHEKKSLVHRDLKPENILCGTRSNDVDVKLTDFGLAKNVTQEGLKTFCGTPQYFAPEVLRRNYTIAGKGRYGREADMWSLGVILYILLSGMPPFDASQGIEAVGDFKVTFPESYWLGVSSSARDLVKQLLMTDPKQRLSVVNACDHSWILMKDGDTHTNPLDDPAAPMRASTPSKRLFGAVSPNSQELTPTPEILVSSTPQILVNSTPQILVSSTPQILVSSTPTPEILVNSTPQILVSSTTSPQILASSSQVTPPQHVPVPEDLNNRSNNFREIVARSAEKEKKRSPELKQELIYASVTPRAKTKLAEPTARELTDDEICSHFSDDSRSSFTTVSTKGGGDLGRNGSASSASTEEAPPPVFDRDSTIRQTNRKDEDKTTPKAKEKGVDSAASKQQTTLNNWFQKKDNIET